MGIAPGTIIGVDFEIVRPLAAGGMGSVFVAKQRSLNMLRALKLMNIALLENTELRERFDREARISASIESDHVVQVINCGIDPKLGLPWIAMELLEGAPVREYVRKNVPLPLDTIALIWSQFGAGMTAAQKAGVIHRDIKPENVFLAKSRLVGVPFIVKVLDFGIAKIVSDNHQNTIQAGSPLYMAPEQMSQNGQITNATDVWAMGLFAFFLFTAKHFWETGQDKNAGMAQVLMEVSTSEIPKASVRAAQYGGTPLPPGFDEWFARCVTRKPEARFPGAAEATQALADVFAQANSFRGSNPAIITAPSISGTVVGTPLIAESDAGHTAPLDKPPTFSPSVRTDASVSVSTKPSAQAPAEKSSKSLMLGLGAAVGVLAIGGIALVATDKKNPDPEPPALTIGNEAIKANTAEPSKAAAPTSITPATARVLPGMVEIAGASYAIADDPGHKETLPAFFIDTTEVTVDAYRKCVDAGTCTKAAATIEWAGASAATQQEWSKLCNSGQTNRDNHPVNCVTWDQATQYCKFVEKRLPTEAEWEYATRGSEGRAFPWGAAPVTVQHANLCDKKCADFASKLGIKWAAFDGDDGFEGTAPVGSFPMGTTASGIQDLHGNVAEWTSTQFCKSGGSNCGEYVVRGGGCHTERTENVTMTSRATKAHDFKSMNIGFRCAILAQDATRK